MIATPILGGLIGFSTNVVAIRMLFRPHTEKRIFGIKLPFTPGMIPKERRMLAKKVGETVGGRLLTAETLKESMLTDDIKNSIGDFLDRFIDNIKNDGLTVKQYAEKFFGDDFETYISKFDEYLYEQINKIASDETINKNFIDILRDKLADSSIDTIIEEKDISRFKGLIKDNIGKIAEIFINYLNNNPDLEEKLKTMIGGIIREGFGGFIGAFVSSNKTYNNIKSGIYDFLTEEENKVLLDEKIDQIVDYFAEYKLDTLFEKVDFEKLDSSKNSLSIFNIIYPLITKRIFEFKAKSILMSINPETMDSLKAMFVKFVLYALEKGAIYISDNMNISSIVEDKINSFDVQTAEDIILSVVRKELRVITWLGGVLGFIIGLVPVFLGMMN